MGEMILGWGTGWTKCLGICLLDESCRLIGLLVCHVLERMLLRLKDRATAMQDCVGDGYEQGRGGEED